MQLIVELLKARDFIGLYDIEGMIILKLYYLILIY